MNHPKTSMLNMIDIKTLQDLLTQFDSTNNSYSPELPQFSVRLMQVLSNLIVTSIKNDLLRHSEAPEPLKHVIKVTLGLYWLVSSGTNLTYTRHPFAPINQLLLGVATAIAGPDESICQLLMPSVTGVVGQTGTLKEETEVNGRFAPENYVLNDSHTQLIPVADIFEYARNNTNIIIARHQSEPTQVMYPLSPRELHRLQEVSGQASRKYWHALNKRHDQQYDNFTFGFYLKNFALALHRASVKELGREEVSEQNATALIVRDFYTFWRGLNGEPFDTVKALTLKNWGYEHATLDDYLLTIFYLFPEYCNLEDNEKERVQTQNILPCSKQLSENFEQYLIQYPQLYQISLDSSKSNPIVNLSDLADSAIESLTTRGQCTDGDDSCLLPYLLKLGLRHNIHQNLASIIVNRNDFGLLISSINYVKIVSPSNPAVNDLLKDILILLLPRIATLLPNISMLKKLDVGLLPEFCEVCNGSWN